MPWVKLTITGIEETIRGVDEALVLWRQYIAAELEWFGRIVSEDAQRDHPYQDQTGALTRSIGFSVESWRGNGIQVNVFATASYANAVEFGTSRSDAYPFLFPKFYLYIGELYVRLQAAAEKALADGGKAGGASQRFSA